MSQFWKSAVLLALLGASSCTSKFEEKSTVGLQADSKMRTEVALQSQQIEERIAKTKLMLNGISVFLKKLEIPGQKMSASDLMVQILDSVSSSSIEKVKNGFESHGELYYTGPGVSVECRSLQTRSSFTFTDKVPRHIISVKTCKTAGAFQELFELIVTADSQVSILPSLNISQILPDINLFEFLAVQNCQLQESRGVILSIQCQLSDLVLSATEKVRFTKFEFLRDRDPSLIAVGILYSSERPSFSITFEIDRAGKSSTRISPLERNENEDGAPQ